MPKTVSASEAKNRLGSVMEWVRENRDEVIIENHGAPSVVVIAYDEYEQMLKLREAERRKQAWEQLQALREQVRARNQDITTEEEAIEIADEIVRDAVQSLIEKGKLRFEP